MTEFLNNIRTTGMNVVFHWSFQVLDSNSGFGANSIFVNLRHFDRFWSLNAVFERSLNAYHFGIFTLFYFSFETDERIKFLEK